MPKETNDGRVFCAQSPGVNAPCNVTEVRILGDKKRTARCASGAGRGHCGPSLKTRQQARVRGLWHLDPCEFETIVHLQGCRARLIKWK